MQNEKRFGLLSEEELQVLYVLPSFNIKEQDVYFSLNRLELTTFDKYIDPNIWVHAILQLGYFKAKQQFFKFTLHDVKKDVEYITSKYLVDLKPTMLACVSEYHVRKQKQEILSLCNYKDWTIEIESTTKIYLCELLRYYPKSNNALRQLLNYFSKNNIVTPNYRRLQDLFTIAYSKEMIRLSELAASMPNEIHDKLKSLIERDDGISQLSLVKADQKDFQFTAVRAEIDKVHFITDLYEFSKEFVPRLMLAKNAVRYYADLVEQYSASRLRKLEITLQWIYTICFIQYRFQQLMDNLIISFMYHIRSIIEARKAYVKLANIEHNAKMIVDFPKLAGFLNWFPERDKNLTHAELNQKAYDILPKEQFPLLAKYLAGSKFDKKDAERIFYLDSTRLLSLYLRPMVIAIPFEYCEKNSNIMEMLNLIKSHYSADKSPSSFKLCDDLGFTIPKNMTKYLKRNEADKFINPYLFEYYVYEKVYHRLGRGKLVCNDSVSYCDIEFDLVDDALVDNVEEIAHKFNYPKIPFYCKNRLDEILLELHYAWNNTVDNINSGRNHGFKFKEIKGGENEWSLLYDASEKLDDSFFKGLPKTSIANIMMFIGNITNMWGEFEHIKDRYVKKKKPPKIATVASILSQAFGFGETKMGEMSDMKANILRTTREDFIRVETLCNTNDIVNNYTASLPIFKLWNLIEDKILADADGQKFATTNSTIQSRYSKKYLGKGRGISLQTLIANHVAVNAKNIGLNEYEGHSLFDMIYNNTTDVDIDMITGDNHSLNKLNFIALDAIDVEYVPSIKNVRGAANNLCSATSPDNYTGILTPKVKANVSRIKSQERNILRVLLSLILQENTQTNLIRKLNSHDRYARLQAGLFEYNNIFKSIHILNLIDNMGLRKAIRSARNRTESYHQLQGTIRKIYHGVFRGKKIVDNRISAHATRLVANCIIAYNSTILNMIYETMLASNATEKELENFGRISPVAWIHILLTGKYNFSDSNAEIDIQKMANILTRTIKPDAP